jgi:hypothetical protein
VDEQKKIGDTKRGGLKIMQNTAFAELMCSQIQINMAVCQVGPAAIFSALINATSP